GIYKSVNGGTSWSLIDSGLPSGTALGNTKIAIAPTDHETLYVSMAVPLGSPNGGSLLEVMKSVNGGTSWTQLTAAPNYLGGQGWYDMALAVDPLTADTIYAGGQSSFVRSLDGGATWVDISTGANGHGPHVDHHAIDFDAAGRL